MALFGFLKSLEHFLANGTRKRSSRNIALVLLCRECLCVKVFGSQQEVVAGVSLEQKLEMRQQNCCG